MKKLSNVEKISLGFIVLIIIVFCIFKDTIISNFIKDPGNYLVQLVCMLLPLLLTFHIAEIESRQRKLDIKKQNEDIKRQEDVYHKIINLLSEQASQQLQLSENINFVSEQLRKLRRPEGLIFIYKYKDRLIKYISYTESVSAGINVIARFSEINNIFKEWEKVSEDEVPLGIIKDFNDAKFFIREYKNCLILSFLAIYNNSNNSDIFHYAFNNSINIGQLMKKGMGLLTQMSDEQLGKFQENYNLEEYGINSYFELTSYINAFSNYKNFADLEKSIQQFHKQIEHMYNVSKNY